jgi:hypothetical protein
MNKSKIQHLEMAEKSTTKSGEWLLWREKRRNGHYNKHMEKLWE